MTRPQARPQARPSGTSSRRLAGFRSFYGAGPLHLIGLLLALALTAYTLSVIGISALWDPEVWWQSILVWFLGAVIVHDLILFPLYAAADRVLSRVVRSPSRTQQERRGVPALNYLRISLMAVALMFVVFYPGILGQGADSYLRATGQTQDPFLARWLLLSAIIFGVAAAAYAIRLLAHRRATASSRSAAATGAEADSDSDIS